MLKKTLIIGLDGARLDVIKKWVDEGVLPNLACFFKEGVYANLESVYPIHSIPAWVSFATGKNPVNHGLYDILIRKGNSYRRAPPTSMDISGETLWGILTRHNKTIGIINHPVTYPLTKVNGIMVCGWLTPSDEHEYAHPKELWNELKAKGYRTTFTANPETKEEFIEEIYTLTKKQIAITKHFMEKYTWDFTFIMINGTEILHHHYASFIDPKHPLYNPSYEEIVKEYYRFVDSEIGRLVEKAGNANVFIVSDHGFTPFYGKLYLNSYFRKWGFLKLRGGIKGHVYMQAFNAINFLKKRGKLIYPFLPRFVKGKALEKYRGFEGEAFDELIDWSNTFAYCPIPNGNIYLNLKNREPGGIIDKEEYEIIREKIAKKILREPKLKEMIENVVKKEELYPEGPYFDELPDLYIKFKRTCKIEVHPASKSLFESPNSFQHPKEDIGYHTIDGIFLAKGPDIKKEELDFHPKIIDIVPTMLYLFGLPVVRDMDGRVLREIFDLTSDISKRAIIFEEKINTKEKLVLKIGELKKLGKI